MKGAVWTGLKLVLIGFYAICMISCEGSDDNQNQTQQYINWKNSSNGQWVLDAGGDNVRFESDTRQMEIKGTLCPNFTVGTDSGFYQNNNRIGRLVGTKGSKGGTIVVLAGNSDNERIDLYGKAPDLNWKYYKIPTPQIVWLFPFPMP